MHLSISLYSIFNANILDHKAFLLSLHLNFVIVDCNIETFLILYSDCLFYGIQIIDWRLILIKVQSGRVEWADRDELVSWANILVCVIHVLHIKNLFRWSMVYYLAANAAL